MSALQLYLAQHAKGKKLIMYDISYFYTKEHPATQHKMSWQSFMLMTTKLTAELFVVLAFPPTDVELTQHAKGIDVSGSCHLAVTEHFWRHIRYSAMGMCADVCHVQIKHTKSANLHMKPLASVAVDLSSTLAPLRSPCKTPTE